jgi:SAM-dependent methyltransferase
MKSFAERHKDRARAESFGAVAEDYERHRPAFPDALLDELAALGAHDVLDVGCGTGKVARGLAARGMTVLGVEIDPRMAEVARERGVTVEVAPFEDWDAAGRRFELVTSGDAWHWIEPARGAAQLARVLRPGGMFVRFWNILLLDDAVLLALEPVYQQHAPAVFRYGRAVAPDADLPPLPGPLTETCAKTYLGERRATAAEWCAFLRTVSEIQRLPDEQRGRLLAAMQAALVEPIRVRHVTTAVFAQRD